ncbi:MAG: tetratricopeptide repeat protein [Asgard group archaeon]|nr:tetratricopeptide repeat protein [Asgard group archaeon]
MSNSLRQQINSIEKLYFTGKFSEALNEIMNLINVANKDKREYFQILIWKNRISIKLGNYSDAIRKLDDLIEEIKKKGFQNLILDAILLKITLLNETGKFEKVLSEINFGESLVEKLDDSEQKVFFNTLFSIEKGKFYSDKSENDIAETLYIKALEMCNNLKLFYTKAEVLINLSFISRKRGDKELTIKYLNESLQICNENEFAFMKGKALQAFSLIYNLEGKLHEALTYLQQAYNLFKEIGSIYELGQVNINLGVINHFSGNLNSAISYYKKALEYFQLIGNKNLIAAANYNTGLIYNLQGKLRDALDSYESSLPIFQELGNMSQITACFNSIGKIFFDLGLLDKAENHLRLVYQLKDQITKIALSKTLFYLIPVLIYQNNLDEAKQLIMELEKISEKEEVEVIKHRYLYLRALVQNSDDYIDYEEIEKLYLQVINEPITDQETTICAIIHHSYLLIDEYTKNNDEEVLERIKYNNERLSKLATKQQSKLLFVEFYWIKSIIASLEGDEITSKELSTQAQNMAKEMSFIRLLNKMKNFTFKF